MTGVGAGLGTGLGIGLTAGVVLRLNRITACCRKPDIDGSVGTWVGDRVVGTGVGAYVVCRGCICVGACVGAGVGGITSPVARVNAFGRP